MVQNAVNLLSIELGEFLLGHHVDKEVVADLRVSVDTLTMGLSYALRKDTRVLGVEQKVDSGEFDVVVRSIPVADVGLLLCVVAVDENWAPTAYTILVFVKTFSSDGLETSILLVTK
jgi:hypothetical protein